MIVGTLYWDANSEDYKICSYCYAEGGHMENHIFL